MSDSAKLTALITGGSSGIGYELAKLFARDGYDLVLVATHAERLAEAAREIENSYRVRVKIIACDLAFPDAGRIIHAEVQRDGITVHALVNNAGFGVSGLFAEVDLRKLLDMIAVHVSALTELTGLFLPDMLKRRSGRILNVASTAGFQPGPLMSVYYATKAYQISFSEALANETRGTSVTVSVLCPGPTATNFQKRAGTKRSGLFEAVMMDAASVARIGYRGLMKGKPLIVPGIRNLMLAELVRILPRRVVPLIVRAIHGQRRTS